MGGKGGYQVLDLGGLASASPSYACRMRTGPTSTTPHPPEPRPQPRTYLSLLSRREMSPGSPS